MDRDINLYNITEDPSSLRNALLNLRRDFDAHNHDGVNSPAFQTLLAETMSARAFSIRKASYSDNTAGFWTGVSSGVVKLNIGNSTNYVKWDGSAISIKGDITGGSLNINNNAVIDSSGNATFVGLTSLNMKAYTNFEASGRFVLTGDVAPTFTNRGMVVAPGATANHYARALWNPVNAVFSNNPSFSAVVFFNTGLPTLDGAAFIGLGVPNISGFGITGTGRNYCGFLIQKTSGTISLYAQQCDGSGSATGSSALTTVTNSDVLELILKMSSTNVKYYWRKNGGTLSSATTLSSTLPSGGEDNVSFMSTNKNSAENFDIQLQCAAYEH